MSKLDQLEHVHLETREQWRAWLATHHASSPGIWLVTWRAGAGRSVLAYDDIVLEALAFGWIDSRGGKVDAQRTRLLMTPRKPGSAWSRLNKQRIALLETDGRMAPAGVAVVAAARADGAWSRLDEVEDLVVPPDLAAAFDALPGSRDQWDAFPRSARRAILEWINSARTADTRARRVGETATLAARGERANQWPRGGR